MFEIKEQKLIVINAKRRKGETFESLIRRFNRTVIKSGKIIDAKKGRFRQKEMNDNAQKESALRRRQLRGKMDYLRRIGKVPTRRRRYW